MQESFLYKYCKTHGWIATNIIVAIYFLFALGVFIVPGDILSRCEICREFVNFMKQYFPNIQIFSDVSPFKQEIEFYTSYMWVLGLFLAAEMVFYATCAYTLFYSEDKLLQEKVKSFGWVLLFFAFSFSFFAIKVYYTSYIVTDGVTLFAKDFDITFESKFEIFVAISFFQFAFSCIGLSFLASAIYTLFYKIFSKENQNHQI